MGAIAGPMLGSAVAGSPLGKFISAVGGDGTMGMGQTAGGNPFSAAKGNVQPQATQAPPSQLAADGSPFVAGQAPQGAPTVAQTVATPPMAAPAAAPTVGGGGNMTNPKALDLTAQPPASGANGYRDPLVSAPNAKPASDSLAAYRAGIQNNESNGNYQLVGNATNGDHPYGAYGVMGANIGPWTKAALGTELTPQQFLASPEAQDKVFDHQFAQYVMKYGAEGAAQAWLGGEGSVGKTDRRDNLGTSVGGYGKKFMNFVNSYDPNAAKATGSSFTPDVMSAKDGQSANGPQPDNLLLQTSLDIMNGKADGSITTPPVATEKPSAGAEVLGGILSRVGHHGAPQVPTAQTAPSQTVDLGAQDVASAAQAATGRVVAQAGTKGVQRRQALEARVKHQQTPTA